MNLIYSHLDDLDMFLYCKVRIHILELVLFEDNLSYNGGFKVDFVDQKSIGKDTSCYYLRPANRYFLWYQLEN